MPNEIAIEIRPTTNQRKKLKAHKALYVSELQNFLLGIVDQLDEDVLAELLNRYHKERSVYSAFIDLVNEYVKSLDKE